jgi:hypothetical protein
MTLTEILKAVIKSDYGWSVAEQFEDTFNGSQSFEDQNENALKYINSMLKDILNNKLNKIHYGDLIFSDSANQEIITYQRELQDYLKDKMADGGMMAKGGVPRKRKYDDGGMMEKGGWVKGVTKNGIKYKYYEFNIDSPFGKYKYVIDGTTLGGYKFNYVTDKILSDKEIQDFFIDYNENYNQNADGGVMAKGGVPRKRIYADGGMMDKGGETDGGKYYDGTIKRITDVVVVDYPATIPSPKFVLPKPDFEVKEGELYKITDFGITKNRWKELLEETLDENWNDEYDHYYVDVLEVRKKTDDDVLTYALGGLFGDSRYNYGRSLKNRKRKY